MLKFLPNLLEKMNETDKIIEKFKEKLEEILEAEFPKHQCLERGHALVLFSYAVIFLKEALKEKEKEQIMAIDSKVLKELGADKEFRKIIRDLIQKEALDLGKYGLSKKKN